MNAGKANEPISKVFSFFEKHISTVLASSSGDKAYLKIRREAKRLANAIENDLQ